MSKNFNQPPATISPDFAAGPTTTTATEDAMATRNHDNNNGQIPSKVTKIENPFDVYINASSNNPAVSNSNTGNNMQYQQQATQSIAAPTTTKAKSESSSWFSLMNDGTAALDVFQLLPPSQVKNNNTIGTDPKTQETEPIIEDYITKRTSSGLGIDQKNSMDTLGFDPETYSYDEEMGAIYAESVRKSTATTSILRTLSEEDDDSNLTTDNNNVPVLTMTSLMAATSNPLETNDGKVASSTTTATSISRILPKTKGQPKEGVPQLPSLDEELPPPMYDYSDVAMQGHHQTYIPSSATFDSNVSSIGDIDPQFTTSSDIIRQHNINSNQATKMVSMGTGSIVMVETASSSEQEGRTKNGNDDTNNDDEDEDDKLAARIMFVLQGAAALNSNNTTNGANNSNATEQVPKFISPNQPTTSMTDSQIYVSDSDDNKRFAVSTGDAIDDDDIDNIPPATIVVPSSSLSSPLSQQQQERQHIVLEPFSYASSTDDGDNEAINGFFGDTDTEEEDVIALSRGSQSQQQSYGPNIIPAKNNDTMSSFSSSSLKDANNLSTASDTNRWINATPAVAMTAAGLVNQKYDNITILQNPQAPTAHSQDGVEDVQHKMSYLSSLDGTEDTNLMMPSQHQQPVDSGKSIRNDRKGQFPQQDDETKIIDDSSNDKNRCSRYWCAIYVGFIFLFVGVALLIYFLVRNDDDASVESPSSPVDPPLTKSPLSPTFSPTLVPSATLPPILLVRDELFLQLQNVSSDYGVSINTSDTPQSMAFDWLLSDPKINDYSVSKRITRFALASFFFSTGGNTTVETLANTSTNITNSSLSLPPTLWLDNHLWLSFEDECEWYTRARSGLCGTSNDTKIPVVQHLDVSYNNLLGTIPPEIGLLTHLQTLSIGGGPDTSLSGNIPSEIGNLSLLKELRLSFNQLSGRVPASIGRCSLLQSIDLSNNHLRGLIPSDIGMIENLIILSLDHNAFQGPIPTTIGQCTGIKTLNLAHNELSLLPKELYDLSNLIFLDLQNNTLAGPFEAPNELGGLSNINTILLSRNELSGPLPIEFNKLSTLKVLDLSNNAFTGTIPEFFIDNIATNTSFSNESTTFDSNIFADNNTSTVSSLLRIFQLNNNLLTGDVPESFNQLSNIHVLSLHSNLLNGTVPTIVCDTFNVTRATLSIDCLEVECSCCIFCCNMNSDDTTNTDPVVVEQQLQPLGQPQDDEVCICRYWNTTMEWLCY